MSCLRNDIKSFGKFVIFSKLKIEGVGEKGKLGVSGSIFSLLKIEILL